MHYRWLWTLLVPLAIFLSLAIFALRQRVWDRMQEEEQRIAEEDVDIWEDLL